MARRLITAVIVSFLFLASVNARAQENCRVQAEPERIEIGLFYGGREVNVHTDMPPGYDAVIKVSGRGEDLELKKKGKKAGILWMNVGEVNYKAVPSLFIVRSSRPLDKIAARETLERLGIGYDALEAVVTADAGDDARALFGELIKLKEREKLFSVADDGVKINPAGSGASVEASLFFPPKVPRGEYRLEVFGFKEGQGELLGYTTIKLEFAPSTQFIFQMARDHGLIYGILAVVTAIFAGLMTGLIFRGKGGAH
jgi:uncharacterized protein (TIGR02186 family)